MKSYEFYLMEQFKQSLGLTSKLTNSETLKSELADWIKLRKTIGEKYLEFLYNNGCDIFGRDTLEIGKGNLDTLVKPFETRIVTPYSKGIKVKDNSRIINADFKVYNGKPVFVNNKGKTDFQALKTKYPLTFMTQNPYTPSHVLNWEQLHNQGNNKIVVGIYGNIYDEDRAKKIKELQQLRDKLQGSFIEKYEILGDFYFAFIASKKGSSKIMTKKYNFDEALNSSSIQRSLDDIYPKIINEEEKSISECKKIKLRK